MISPITSSPFLPLLRICSDGAAYRFHVRSVDSAPYLPQRPIHVQHY